jgi:carbamoyl-phosphate synthase large subunit
MGVRGLLNIQLALYMEKIYVLEVNPRSSRSVPFVSKANGVSLAHAGTLLALGQNLESLCLLGNACKTEQVAVKFPVFPFAKFLDSVPRQGPEMRSIGEVMSVADSFPAALAKSFLAAGFLLKRAGRILILTDRKLKDSVAELCRVLQSELGLRPTLVVAAVGGDVLASDEGCFDVYQAGEGPKALAGECGLGQVDPSESAACTLVLCDRQSTELKPLICKLHSMSVSQKTPFILSEQLFEAWGRALFAVEPDAIVSPLKR